MKKIVFICILLLIATPCFASEKVEKVDDYNVKVIQTTEVVMDKEEIMKRIDTLQGEIDYLMSEVQKRQQEIQQFIASAQQLKDKKNVE